MALIGVEGFREGQDDRTMKRPQAASAGESDEESEETPEPEPSQIQQKGRSVSGHTNKQRTRATGSRRRASLDDEEV